MDNFVSNLIGTFTVISFSFFGLNEVFKYRREIERYFRTFMTEKKPDVTGRLREGDLVIRGPTWEWGNQDIDSTTKQSMVGIVTEREIPSGSGSYWYSVRWLNNNDSYNYRYGGDKMDIVPIMNYSVEEISSLSDLIAKIDKHLAERKLKLRSQVFIGSWYGSEISSIHKKIKRLENNEIQDIDKILKDYETINKVVPVLQEVRNYLADIAPYYIQNDILWYCFIILGQEEKALDLIDENIKIEEHHIRRLLQNNQYAVLERLFELRKALRIVYGSIGLRIRINTSYEKLPKNVFSKMRQFLMLEGHYNLLGTNHKIISLNGNQDTGLSKSEKIKRKYISFKNWIHTHVLESTTELATSQSCSICHSDLIDDDESDSDEFFFQKAGGTECTCYYHTDCAIEMMNLITKNLQIDQSTQVNRIDVNCLCKKEIKPSFIYCVLLSKTYPDYNNDIHSLKELNDDIIYEELDKFNSGFIKKLSRENDIIACPKESCTGFLFVNPYYQEKVKCEECSEETMITGRMKALEDMKENPSIKKLLEENEDYGSCPHCKKLIQKNGGCPNMFCTYCKKKFHWEDTKKSVKKEEIHF